MMTKEEVEKSKANLIKANLIKADLSEADLSEADLRWANLNGANLSKANLSEADLSGADLRRTCLDPDLHTGQRLFCKQCPPPPRTGGRIVYRTAESQHIGNTKYNPGHTYIAPVLSASVEAECHPGIYASSLEWMRNNYPGKALVRCYVRDGDWFYTAKGCIRCKRIRVLSYVE